MSHKPTKRQNETRSAPHLSWPPHGQPPNCNQSAGIPWRVGHDVEKQMHHHQHHHTRIAVPHNIYIYMCVCVFLSMYFLVCILFLYIFIYLNATVSAAFQASTWLCKKEISLPKATPAFLSSTTSLKVNDCGRKPSRRVRSWKYAKLNSGNPNWQGSLFWLVIWFSQKTFQFHPWFWGSTLSNFQHQADQREFLSTDSGSSHAANLVRLFGVLRQLLDYWTMVFCHRSPQILRNRSTYIS